MLCDFLEQDNDRSYTKDEGLIIRYQITDIKLTLTLIIRFRTIRIIGHSDYRADTDNDIEWESRHIKYIWVLCHFNLTKEIFDYRSKGRFLLYFYTAAECFEEVVFFFFFAKDSGLSLLWTTKILSFLTCDYCCSQPIDF